MIRSLPKGIYSADTDEQLAANIPEIKTIADKTYGFAKLCPSIIEEYFEGMYRHL